MEDITGKLRVGNSARTETVVNEQNIAKVRGDSSRQVFSTPSMISLMEQAAVEAADPLLPEGWLTVGSAVNIRHLAATPIGKTVHAEAELLEIDGRRLVFKVEAYDDARKIGEGTHERFIVNLARFLERSKSQA